ncbi:32167_t:CDS:2, partial [Racocetra persica]
QDHENAKLMQIGIQTAIAISIHKFPEGLITFVSSKASRSLGISLFAAIALHNIVEGLTIALPIYIATRSRIKAFLYASILGGLSQPLGALIGWLFLNESFFNCWNHYFIYGALFAATSGLMGVICINGMLPQAIKHDTKDGQSKKDFGRHATLDSVWSGHISNWFFVFDNC